MESLAPVVLFVYNRPDHTRKTVESLLKNSYAGLSNLFVFSDGAKSDSDRGKVAEVREYIRSIHGFRSIKISERNNNLGLAKSVITGVSDVLNFYNKVIVLEDDMISSSDFLSYMNELLDFYENDGRIFSVTGYAVPINIPPEYKCDIYLSPRASSWGWGTWRDRWSKVDWDIKDYKNFLKDRDRVEQFNKGGEDLTRMLWNQKTGKIDSWAIIWTYAHFNNNAYCVYPVKSRIRNIGTDKSGVHMKKTRKYNVELTNDYRISPVKNIMPDKEILSNFKAFYKKNFLSSLFRKILFRLSLKLSAKDI